MLSQAVSHAVTTTKPSVDFTQRRRRRDSRSVGYSANDSVVVGFVVQRFIWIVHVVVKTCDLHVTIHHLPSSVDGDTHLRQRPALWNIALEETVAVAPAVDACARRVENPASSNQRNETVKTESNCDVNFLLRLWRCLAVVDPSLTVVSFEMDRG
jgi:hypothetical protein